jgi:hypothetical protein
VFGVISGVNTIDDCLRSVNCEVAMELNHSVSGIDQVGTRTPEFRNCLERS